MGALITKDNLPEYWDNEAFVKATIEQINKDFAKFNIKALDYDESQPQIDQLVDEMRMLLMDFFKHQSAQLPQLMYAIDIPEKAFNQLTSSLNFFGDLAEMILHREALKVFLRKKFS